MFMSGDINNWNDLGLASLATASKEGLLQGSLLSLLVRIPVREWETGLGRERIWTL